MQIILNSGTAIEIPETQGQRVLYALTSLAAAGLADQVKISRVVDETGHTVWPPASSVCIQGTPS